MEEVSLGFQKSNPVVFDIRNSVMMNLKSNQFSVKESKDCNAHVTHFLDACNILIQLGVGI
jgi:ABC-type phosphate transport system ATPase subunit